MRHNEQREQRRYDDARQDDQYAQQITDYYGKPQNDTQLNNNYIEPGTPDLGIEEWTRDSVIGNYGSITQRKILWCVEEIRILEMMIRDARMNGDLDFIDNFAQPLIRFNISEKAALENTSRNIGGYGGQLSRSNFSYIQQDRFNTDATQQQKNPGLLGKLKLPRFGGGGGMESEAGRMGWSGV